jgi:NUMOD4 motif/HNH endonuclease
MERWRPIRGFEGYYEVSDQGRVKSLSRMKNGRPGYRPYRIPERILVLVPIRTRLDGKSRVVVSLHREDIKRWARVPHLVLEAFKGPRPSPKHESRHLNCDPSDNRAVNLEWGTQQENHADTLQLDHILRGERHPNAKLTTKQIKQIRELRAAGVSGSVICTCFGITHNLVYLIAKRKAWAHV